MSREQREPVVLELAPPSREKLGPFLILGVAKDANQDTIEAHWARRLIWARKNQFRLPLEDINWARDLINDPARRPRADAASLNQDTTEGALRRLEERHGGDADSSRRGTLGWRPLDVEKPLTEYDPNVDMPDPEAVRAAIRIPEIPQEVPAASSLLEELTRTPLDPWALPAGLEPSSAASQEPTA